MELFILLAVLQLADIYTTHRVLSQGGRELNPILAWLFQRFGHLGVLIAVKTAFLGLTYGYLLDHPVIMSLLCAVYLYVVLNNAKAERHVKKEK